MRMTTPEGKVKHAIKKVLDDLGIYYHMPVQNGMGKPTLDFICCVGGAYVAIEAKAPSKVPTRRQEALMKEIRASGGCTFWINQEADVGLLNNALVLIKEKFDVMKALEE